MLDHKMRGLKKWLLFCEFSLYTLNIRKKVASNGEDICLPITTMFNELTPHNKPMEQERKLLNLQDNQGIT